MFCDAVPTLKKQSRFLIVYFFLVFIVKQMLIPLGALKITIYHLVSSNILNRTC